MKLRSICRWRRPWRGDRHVPRRSRHRAGTHAAVVFVAASTLVPLLAVPALADDQTTLEAPEGCVVKVGDTSVGGTPSATDVFQISANGHEYLKCEDDLEGGDWTCVDTVDEINAQWNDGDYLCVPESLTILTCRDDIRFTVPFRGTDDPSRAFFSDDTHGLVIVPTDTPQWWREEVDRESTVDHGQGCHVAKDLPHAPCAEVRERRAELRDDQERLEGLRELENEGMANTGFDQLEYNEVVAELEPLESLGFLVPDDCWGTFPNSSYGLSYDMSGDDLSDPGRLLFWLAQLIFGIAKTVMMIVLWLLPRALVFDVTEYRYVVGSFAGRIDQQLVHLGGADLSLFDFAWFGLFAAAGFHAIRNRAGRAGAEILIAVVLAGVGVALVGNFFPEEDGEQYRPAVQDGDPPAFREDGYFDSVGRLLNVSALGVMRIGMGEDPDISHDEITSQSVEEVVGPMAARLHEEFIERAYLFVQYGTDDVDMSAALDGPSDQMSCSQVVRALMSVDDVDGAWAGRFLQRNGCEAEAAHNRAMDINRMMDVVLASIAMVTVAAVLGATAVTLFVSKFLVAVFFVALPLAVVVAILPGRTRSLAWGWATTLLQLWLAAMAAGLTLALLLIGLDVVNTTGQDRDMAERWLMVIVMVMVVTVVRQRLQAGARAASQSLQQRLSSLSETGGGARPRSGSPPRPPMTDINLANADRRTAQAINAGAAGVAVAAPMVAAAGKRVAQSAHWWTTGAAWRSQVARGRRYRTARKSQETHWANSLEASRVGQARDVQQSVTRKADADAIAVRAGGKPDPNPAAGTRRRAHQEADKDRKESIKRHRLVSTHGETRDEARRLDAKVAIKDHQTLRSVYHTQAPLTDEGRAAAQRLGMSSGDIAAWDRAATQADPRHARRKIMQDTARQASDYNNQVTGNKTLSLTSQENDEAKEAIRYRNEHHGLNAPRARGFQESFTKREQARQRAEAQGRPEEGPLAVAEADQRYSQRRATINRNVFTEQGAEEFLDGRKWGR